MADTILYAVYEVDRWDGENLVGVYSTKELAMIRRNELFEHYEKDPQFKPWEIQILQIMLDQPHDYLDEKRF